MKLVEKTQEQANEIARKHLRDIVAKAGVGAQIELHGPRGRPLVYEVVSAQDNVELRLVAGPGEATLWL